MGPTRTRRRANTKSVCIPGTSGPTGIYEKFRFGRYKRPKGLRFTKTNEKEWRG